MKEIPLTQGKVALVDDADFELVSKYKWCASELKSAGNSRWYAITGIQRDGKDTTLSMHRLILGLDKPSIHVDHIDHDGLNNQRGNLRAATRSGNQGNQRKQGVPKTSNYKGVWWSTRDSQWQSQIQVNGKRKHLGCFTSERVAAFAYNCAAKRLFGEFACLNKIENPPRALLRF